LHEFKDNLAALVPDYGLDGGNVTRIYTLDGAVETDRRSIKWNLQRLARLYCLDLTAARSRYGEYLQCGRGVPIPFSSRLVLVPLKVRLTVGKNDGTYGYFNPSAAEVKTGSPSDSFRSQLILPGGHAIQCRCSRQTVKKRMKAGEYVLENFIKRGDRARRCGESKLGYGIFTSVGAAVAGRCP